MSNEDIDEQLGKIAYVNDLPDPQNENLKNRRCIVVRRVHHGSHFLLVATTSKFDRDNVGPLEERFRSGNPQQPSRQGFTEPTVAKCGWLAVVIESDCEFTGHRVDEVQLASLLKKTGIAIASKQFKIVRDDRS